METDDYKVFVVKIEKVEKHPNADRLDLAHIKGWQCVTQRNAFKIGDLAVYIPIDSVLPADLEAELFPPDSKVKLSKSRVKTIKLRGAISQGMIVGLDVLKGGFEISELEAGEDLTDALGITHYEPPAPPASMRGDQVSKKKTNKLFPVYPKMSHFKNYPDLFVEGEEVIVTEKIHGTNFRAGWAPMQIDSVWKKVKNFFGFLPKWEFVFGSHQVQLQGKKYNGFYSSNVYQQAVETYDLEAKIPLGIIIYGEIYGPGIQKGYGYGLAEGEHRLAIFDAIMSAGPAEELQGYVSWPMLVALAAEIGVPTVPVIYRGPYHAANVKDWESGHSQLCPTQAHREGVVIKPVSEVVCWIGRKILRSINPEYLLKSESDFH